MKKEVVYSLLAAAAFPGAAMANAPVNSPVNIQSWTGGTYDTSNSVYVSNNGDPISIALGKKAPGKYTIVINDVDAKESALKVEVAGVTKDVDRKLSENQTVSIDFTLTSETDVTIKVSSVDVKAFSVGATTVTLNYDFAKANSLITAELSKASNTIKTYTLADYDHTVWNREEAAIHSILDNYFKDDIDEAYENAYVKYRLWETLDLDNNRVLDNNQILIELKAAWKQSADLYKAAIVAKYQQQLDALKNSDAYKNADQKVKDKVADELAAIQTAIDAVNNTSTDGDLENVTFSDAAITSAINAFNTALSQATTDVAANENAHNRVNAAADAAKGTYLVDLGNALDGAKYAHILAYANKAISKIFEELTAVKEKNEQSYNNETAAADEAARNAEIADITARLQSTYNDYAVTLKALVDGFEAQYDGVKGYNDAIKAQYGEAIYNMDANKDLITNLANAITAVRTAIDAAQTGANEDCQALKTLDLTDLVASVENAKTALDNSCNLIKVRLDAEQAAATAVADVQGKYDEAIAAVGELNYDYENAKANTHDQNWSNNIKSDIDQFAATVAAKKAAVTPGADDFYTSQVAATQTSLINRINEYKNEFTDAAANFNNVNAAVNEAQTKLNDIKARVENTPVWNAPTTGHTTASGINYKAYVDQAQGDIDAAKGRMTATNQGVNKYDQNNTNAVKALQFTESTNVENIINSLTTNYENDSTDMQNQLNAEALQAQKDAIEKKWNDLETAIQTAKNDYANGKLGKDGDALNEEITDLDNAITNEGLEGKVDAAIDPENKDAGTFADVKSRIDYYTDLMNTLQGKIDAAKAAKKANDDAKTAVDNAMTALSWDYGASIISAAGESYTNGQNDEQTKVDALIQAIQNEIDAVNTTEAANFSAQTLADHQTELINTINTTIKDMIADAKAQAGAMKTNFANYNEVVNTYNASFVTTPTVFDQAEAAADARDANVHDTYTMVLINAWKVEANALLADFTANYKADKYGVDGSTLVTSNKTDIQNLVAKINGLEVKGAVTTNHDAYDKTGATADESLKPFENEIEAYWNTRMNELATKDQSSKLPERQAQMNSLLSQLNSQKAKDKANYENGVYGQYDKDGVATNTQAADDRTALQNIYTAIMNLVDEAVNPDNYSKDIEADNVDMWKKVTEAKDNAQKAYKAAIDYVDTFKGLKSSYWWNELYADPAVKAAYDDINANVYPEATDINDKYATAWNEYKNTTSPDIFDRDSSYVLAFRGYEEDINTKYQTFVSAIKDFLVNNIRPDIVYLQGLSTQYKNYANTNYNWTNGDATNWDSFFNEYDAVCQSLINIIDKEKIERGDWTEFDRLMNIIGNNNYQALLNNALNEAAKADVIENLEKAEAEVVAANNGDTKIDDGTLDAYNSVDAAKITRARADYNGEQALWENSDEKYNEIKSLLDSYFTDNAYKTFNENNAAYKNAKDEIQKRQDELNAGLAAVAEYACVEVIRNSAGNIQESIDALKNSANSYNNATPRDKSGLNNVKTQAQSLKTTIDDLFDASGNLFNEELNYLNNRMKELTAEYNVYAADTTHKDIAEQKAFIDGIQNKIDAARAKTVHNAADLQALEGDIKAKLDELANVNGDLLNTTRENLKTALKAVADKVTYGDPTSEAEVIEYIKAHNPSIVAEFDRLTQKIDSLQGAIQSASIFDRERIETQIETFNRKATEIAAQIARAKVVAQAEVAAINAAWQDLTDYITNLKKKVTDSTQDLKDTFNNPDAQPEKFENKYGQINDAITAEETKINNWKAEGKDPRNFTKGSINSTIDQQLFEIKNLAAYRQLKADLGTKDPGTPYYEVWQIYNNLLPRTNSDGTPAPSGKDLFTQSDYDHLVSMWTNDIYGAYNDILNDINSDWRSGVSYDDGDDTNGINYNEREAAIDQLKKKIDEFKKFYDTNSTKPDPNRDGLINNTDITAISNAVGLEATGDNAKYDINHDGVIDILDIQVIIKVVKDAK